MFRELKRSNHLPENFPDKYIGAGRIFNLPKAGSYRFRYIYQATENDKNWTFAGANTDQEASIEWLWIGSASSNTIELSIN